VVVSVDIVLGRDDFMLLPWLLGAVFLAVRFRGSWGREVVVVAVVVRNTFCFGVIVGVVPFF